VGKRSSFVKADRDFYRTIDPNAIPYTFVDLIRGKSYADTCYGNGDLEDRLMDVATCKWRSDIRETVGSSLVVDALQVTKEDLEDVDCLIQNPPFTRKVLDPLLDHWLTLGKPVWLLLPADYMHNVSFGKYMRQCKEVISVGRLYFFTNLLVEDKEIKWGFTPDWAKKNITRSDPKIGVDYFSGYWDAVKDKPAKSYYTRGVDNFCWYCFVGEHVEATIFKGR